MSLDKYPVAAGYASGLPRRTCGAGIPFDERLVVDAADAGTVDATGPAHALLDRDDRPTAVFCFGDQIAMGFFQVARALGLAVPDDLSIVGFDNQQFVADALSPGLTTVQLPHREMGRWASERGSRPRDWHCRRPARRLAHAVPPRDTRVGVAAEDLRA